MKILAKKMTKKEHINYWRESAQHDLEPAESINNQKFLLNKINDFNIQTRYPGYNLKFYKRCNAKYTNEYLASFIKGQK